MKKQKVEIELPVIEGWDFDGYRPLTESELNDINVSSAFHFRDECVLSQKYNIDTKFCRFVYKKKKPRRIIYEEVREDHLNHGDFYLIGSRVNMWTLDAQSCEKYQILKKVHDDFEVK